MGVLLFIGLIWFVCELLKEVSIKPVPPGTDHRQIFIDMYSGKHSVKEVERRINKEYYKKYPYVS